MLYRVYADLSFKTKGKAEKLQSLIEPFVKEAVNINEGQPNEELGFLEIRECNHDDISRITPDKVLVKLEV